MRRFWLSSNPYRTVQRVARAMSAKRYLIDAIGTALVWLGLMYYWGFSYPDTNPIIFFGVLFLLTAYMLSNYYQFLFRLTFEDSKLLTVLGWIVLFGVMIIFAILVTPIYSAFCFYKWYQLRDRS